VRHLARGFQLGWSGVDLFFVLSGFLLGGIAIDQRGSGRFFRTFYARRAFRILPLYVVWLGLFLVLRPLGDWPPGLFEDNRPWWSYALYVQNVYDALRDQWGAYWMTISWSLAIEEQFYFLLPSLVYVCPAGVRPALLGLVVIAAPITRYALSLYAPASHLATYTLLPCRWDGLFLGVLAADIVRRPGVAAWLGANPWFLRTGLVMLGGLLTMFLHRAPWPTDPAVREGGFTWIALFAVALLLAALHDRRVGWWFRWRPLRALGVVSYGVYLIHPAILWVVHWSVFGRLPELTSVATAAVTALAAVVTLALAALSYRVMEAPLIRVGHRWRYGERRAPEPGYAPARPLRLGAEG
jgi:peptidoglycan/LPS O-acetylase OafA/YrhL